MENSHISDYFEEYSLETRIIQNVIAFPPAGMTCVFADSSQISTQHILIIPTAIHTKREDRWHSRNASAMRTNFERSRSQIEWRQKIFAHLDWYFSEDSKGRLWAIAAPIPRFFEYWKAERRR
jgi:hypothetical protein